MRHPLSLATLLLLLACSSTPTGSGTSAESSTSTGSPTYAQVLGSNKIRAIVQEELGRVPSLKFGADSIDWAVSAVGGIEAGDNKSIAADELRKGFRVFVTAFGNYARELGLKQITRRELAEFQTRAGCGMFPCSSKCCRRCSPCR